MASLSLSLCLPGSTAELIRNPGTAPVLIKQDCENGARLLPNNLFQNAYALLVVPLSACFPCVPVFPGTRL